MDGTTAWRIPGLAYLKLQSRRKPGPTCQHAGSGEMGPGFRRDRVNPRQGHRHRIYPGGAVPDEADGAGVSSNQKMSGLYMPKCAPGSQLYMPSAGTLRRRALTTIGCGTPAIRPIE